ncbi:SDR family oxidoreductase [Arthrobacter rhombi]|uniref:SDR family oxidoreductase n=1 Tax=Arthrobacter rhombi TaxID=71253 RepID=UPI0031D4563C
MSGYASAFRPDLFAGQTIIVTGGGSGIGRCTAHELAALGAHVVLVGRQQEKLDIVLSEIREDGGSAEAHSGDIRDEDRMSEIVQEVLDDHGRIHGLVNNAGGQYRAALKTIKTKGFEAVLRTNVVGGFIMMREVYNRSMEEHGGAIVNIVADMWMGWPMYGHSGAARSAMWNLTETAAAEWGEAGVRVNAVAPGSIASSGLDTYDPEDDGYMQRDLRGEIPLQRWGTESEISAAITFLLSPAASFTSGSVVRVDGGAPNGARSWVLPEEARNNEPFQGFHRPQSPRILDKK